MFCDASETAYGAVAYLRAVNKDNINVSFVLSKSRLAPIKTTTIPRLELQAAVVAVSLKNAILADLDLELDKIYFWSDSMIVLHYLINANKRLAAYVSHRITEILANSTAEQWRHVPGKLNAADDCTRGLAMQCLRPDHRWFKAPGFLQSTRNTWPNHPVADVNGNELEVKASVLTVTTAATRSVSWMGMQILVQTQMPSSKYSSYLHTHLGIIKR